MSDSNPHGDSQPLSFAREFHGTFNGRQLSYQAVAAETFIRDFKGEAAAAFFTTYYVASKGEDSAARPLLFIFNGGPGSSAHGCTWAPLAREE